MRWFVRKLAWRLGRKLYCWARGDLANDRERNGEYWLLERVLSASPEAGVFMDVGANKGDWTLRALSLADATRKRITVYAFEPSSATRSILSARLPSTPNVEVLPFALSSVVGRAEFFSNGAGSGTNSLSATSGVMSEKVELTTVDAFLEQRGIRRIAMMKIDTEGFDLHVMRGAVRLLTEARVDIVQFEYNWRWLLNGASLRQVFDLIEGMPFRLGKLVGDSIELYAEWHFELDRYFENNYVLVRKGCAIEQLARPVRFDRSNVVAEVE